MLGQQLVRLLVQSVGHQDVGVEEALNAVAEAALSPARNRGWNLNSKLDNGFFRYMVTHFESSFVEGLTPSMQVSQHFSVSSWRTFWIGTRSEMLPKKIGFRDGGVFAV